VIQRQAIGETLRHSHKDAGLAGEAELANRPKDVPEGWKSLWANVDALLAEARTL